MPIELDESQAELSMCASSNSTQLEQLFEDFGSETLEI